MLVIGGALCYAGVWGMFQALAGWCSQDDPPSHTEPRDRSFDRIWIGIAVIVIIGVCGALLYGADMLRINGPGF